jgi:hypothetical protein
MRLSVILTVAALILVTIVARAEGDSCSWNNGRQTLRFYEYQGTQTAEGKANFGAFRQMVDDEITAANQYLSAIYSSSSPNLETKPDLNAPCLV